MIRLLKLNKISMKSKEKMYNNFLNNIDYSFEVSFYDEWNSQRLIDVKFYKNDLCIESFYHNFYMRTPKAVNFKRYKTFSNAIQALKRLFKQCHYYKTSSNLHVYYGIANKKHLFDIEL